jgi:transposase-like protein
MNLIFYDRSTSPQTSVSGEALLTIERSGNFALTVAAVAALKLQPESQALLAQDAETNTWYLVFGPVAGRQTFTLRQRDPKGKALQFCSQPNARTYFSAHGLNQAITRSVRAAVGLEPVRHEQLVLYPLAPRHATKAPASATAVSISPEPVHETPPSGHENTESLQLSEPTPPLPAESTPATEVAVAATPEPKPAGLASKYTAEQDAALLDMANSPSELARQWGVSSAALHTRRAQLKRKAGEPATPPVAAPALVAATSTLIYTPATEGAEQVKKTYGLQARAEELGSYWMERDIARATPGELAEILNLLRHVPASKRGIEMELVLGRAEVEQTHRQSAAGKGGARG